MPDAAPELLAALDPAPAVRAGRRFGQLAARDDGGALMLAAARAIEQEHRATVLIVPGVFRVDLEPHSDTLGVHLRPLSGHPTTWTSTAETIDALDRGNPLEPLGFDVTIATPHGTLAGAVKVVVVSDHDMGAVYVSARATVRPAETAQPGPGGTDILPLDLESSPET